MDDNSDPQAVCGRFHRACGLLARWLSQLSCAVCVSALCGCASVSMPLKPVVTGHIIKQEALQWIQTEQTTRQEIAANWGPPSFELRDDRVFGYLWTVDRTADWQFGNETGVWGTISRRVLFFTFDAYDRITRFEFVRLEADTSLEEGGKRWLMRQNPTSRPK